MNPLEQLNDIQLTDAVGFWPPAYGWWLVSFIGLLTIVIVTKWALARRRNNIARKQFLQELQDLTPDNGLQHINILLKRACISYYGNRRIAPLYGKDWLAFLLQQVKPNKATQLENPLQDLIDSPYRQSSGANFEVCRDAARQWVKAALPPKNAFISTKKFNIDDGVGDV
ncbi:MAG: DUF4381 domain-containing protein [Aestuariibacter sp.]